MPTVLITGASRGIGAEFVRQYAEAGWRVLASARDPGRVAAGGAVSAHRLDVTSDENATALAAELRGIAIDLLINNAGVIGRRGDGLTTFDPTVLEETFSVNVTGPLRVTRALLPNLLAGGRKTCVFLSSRMGSISLTPAGSLTYRVSKAALNMAVRNIAQELKAEGVTAVAVHPGWVRTDMGGPGADLGVEQSVSGLRQVIEGLTPAMTGSFLNHDGSPIPW
ncbi:MAG: SDR family oxidoreductase [Thalassobaculales bacterium]